MTNKAATPDAERVLAILRERDGVETIVRLSKGLTYKVLNIAWGQDMDDPEFHVTTNISPSVPGSTIDFFTTDAVVEILDPGSGQVLFGRRLTSA
jgi:hypothetical protein